MGGCLEEVDNEMDPVSGGIIAMLVFVLIIMLILPTLMNIPFYLYLKAKWTKSMVIFLLKPDKKIDMVLAKPKSSLIQTRKGNLNFLNIPEAIYMLFGIPTALAYHKYGAILPAQNIVHATEMRDKGFKNIGEVEETIAAYNFMLHGNKKNKGLYTMADELKKAIGNPGEGKEKEKEELEAIQEKIGLLQAELQELQNVFIEDKGFIKIQDIFNYLNKNLSTDVIFSVIERSVAEEMRGMRDFTAKFVQMFPYLMTLFVFLLIAIMIIMSLNEGSINMPSVPKVIPNIGP